MLCTSKVIYYVLLNIAFVPAHWPSGWSVCQWPGRPGFNPRLSHTKDLKKKGT